MILGFAEIILIGVSLMILFLPGLLKSRRGKLHRTLNLYGIIILLIVIVLVFARIVYSLLGKLMALTLIVIALIFFTIGGHIKKNG